jgi:hypothetical protein
MVLQLLGYMGNNLTIKRGMLRLALRSKVLKAQIRTETPRAMML